MQRLRFLCAFPMLGIWIASVGSAAEAVLLEDDYRAMTPGMISGGVVGAHTEYHYLSASEPRGNWWVSTFRTPASQRAWRLIEQDGERLIWQASVTEERDRAYNHPLLIAGDVLWTDYTLETKFAPQAGDFQSGVVFRYRTDRVWYFAGVDGQRAVLKRANNTGAFRKLDEVVLAEAPMEWQPGTFIPITVIVNGDRITAGFNNAVTLEVQDSTLPQGKIGFMADTPTLYGPVRVTCSELSKEHFEQARRAADAEEAHLQAGNPAMVLWKKLETPEFGVGRNLRFGDLDGDGKIDILVTQPRHHGHKDRNSEVGCLTAITTDGRILWQNGLPDAWRDHLTSDVGVQIHDLDGDGRNEVIYCRDMEIVVADGATGETKYKAPTPEAPTTEGQTNRFPRILGDCLYFCDFRGLGADRDFVIKDRYHNLWAYTDTLRPLWHVAVNTGHYPYAYDVDGDGRDELAIGYALIDNDGTVLWDRDDQIEDHADGVAIVQLKEDAAPMLQCAASDEGFYFADLQGNILGHHQIGHAQNPSVANYRPDLPGLETVCINFWGNQGIVTFFDADGNRYHDFEPVQHGSMMLPLNWRGDGQEFWVLSPNPAYGGAYDGWGRRVLRFPADGHPDLCVAVLDMTGDCRDEIVVWDPWEIWIYTQPDNPKPGRLYKPVRNPLYNYSNYQTTVSLPGWSE